MNERFYVGNNAASFREFSKQAPITGVFVSLGDADGTGYMAGTEGNVLEVLCYSGTQQIANDLLQKAQGYQYQGFEADSALLPHDAELGDGVTVGGVYAMLANQTLTFGGGHLSDISAPGDDEIDHAYPYVSQEERAITRNIAQTRAQLRVDIDRISSEVAGKIDGEDAQTLIDQSIGEISLSVSGTSGTTTFKLKQGSTTLDTESFDLHVKSVNIEGTLTAEALRGRTVSLLDSADDEVGSMTIAYTTTGYGLAIETDYGGIQINSGGNIYIASAYNTRLLLDDDAAKIGPTVWATDGHIIYSSDRNVKHDIEYDIAKYRDFLLSLKPCRFKFNGGQSGRYHIGLIAQDVEQSLSDCGIDSSEFSGWCRLPIRDEEHNITGYTYGIRYDELIPLNTMLIQELIRRVDALERTAAS